MLMKHPLGNYRFMVGIAPYSCGVIAEPGFEIVHVTFRRSQPWRAGFEAAAETLAGAGLSRSDLCAVHLRCPAPYTMEGFLEFNAHYTQLLRTWNVYVGDVNPIARTNVAPSHDPPPETHMVAFSFVRPAVDEGTCWPRQGPSFVVAGAGELREGTLVDAGIIRRGETSAHALAEKTEYVMQVMADRLHVLGATWSDVHRINIYTIHPLDRLAREIICPQAGGASSQGLHWFLARPPVIDIEYEMDLRGGTVEYIVGD